MGDADVAQNIFSNDSTEILLDEAMTELDQEMDRLFSFINLLHIRLSYAMFEIASWRRTHHCLTAFKLFAIPVVLAMGIVYTMTGLKTSDSIQNGMETLISILMYASMGIGLPLYICSLWELCCGGEEEEDILFLNDVNGKEFTLDDVRESLQNIGQFQALSRALYRHTDRIHSSLIREDRSGEEELEREDSQSESSDGSDGFKVETPAAYNNQKIRLSIPKIMDLDFDDSNVDSDPMSHKEMDEFHVLKFITNYDQEDVLSMNDDVPETRGVIKKLSKQATVGKTRSRKGIRTITIQNVGDSSNVAYKKDAYCNTMDTPRYGTTFGL